MSRPITLRIMTFTLLGLAAGAAQALTPSDAPPDIHLYIPGSQANDAFYQPAVCLPGTAHVYFQNKTPANPSAASNNDYWALYCLTDGTKVSGLTGEKKVWISRRRIGASFVALDAVQNGTPLDYLKDPETANCTPHEGNFTSAGVKFDYNYSCGITTPGITATAATSDVTPDAFRGPDNVPSGKSDIDASKIDNRKAIAGHIVGLAVTQKLRNVLQYAQVLSGSLPSTCAAPGTTTGSNMNETAACMPSLNKQQLASLWGGTISDWDGFRVNVGGTAKTLSEIAAQWVSAGGSDTFLKAPLDTKVHICRREAGAGQQVALLANILQNPCLGNSMVRLVAPGGDTDAQMATSLGAVDNCLKDFNDGSNSFLPASPAHGNQWAMSIQTTERNVTVTGASPYRFIKINGATPTLDQVAQGNYPLWSEYGLSWQNSVSSDQSKVLLAMAAFGQNPVNVNARNAAAVHSFGPAGYIALSSNGYEPDAVFNPANPVNPYTRAASGTPDACTVPVLNRDFPKAELQGAQASASTGQASCALPWGGGLAHGRSVIAYGSAAAADCSTVAEIRSCSNGTLSGSAANGSCTATRSQSQAQVTQACAMPAIKGVTPNGGDTVKVGSRRTVGWGFENLPATNTVDVLFSANGGSSWKPLKKGVRITGSYAWKPAKGQVTSTGKIKVCVLKSKTFGAICATSDGVFAVTN